MVDGPVDEGRAGNGGRFPVDYDSLAKGDYIAHERIEEITGEVVGSEAYSLACLTLAQAISRELWLRGKQWTVIGRDHGIAVLTDVEASEYNGRRFEQGCAVMARSNVRMAAVDAGAFTEGQRRKHDQALVFQGASLAALQAARQRVAPLPVGPARQALPQADAG